MTETKSGKIKIEIEKANKLNPNIVAELNELIYTRAKLVWDKIGVSLRNPNINTKPEWEIRLKG